MTGDCLIFCYKGYSNLDIDPLWLEVDEWRFVLSAWLGFVGMALMLPAFYSFYKMIEETCGKVIRTLTPFMAIGVAATGFLHFALGFLLPITYKSIISSGGTDEDAYVVAEHWREILAPLDMLLPVPVNRSPQKEKLQTHSLLRTMALSYRIPRQISLGLACKIAK